MPSLRNCKQCGIDKDLEQFYVLTNEPRTYRPECKDCTKLRRKELLFINRDRVLERKAKYREKNRALLAEKQREYKANNMDKVAEYRAAHPEQAAEHRHRRRAAKYAEGRFLVTEKELRKILNSPCFYCGSTFKTTIDHVVPLSRGGRHSIGNLLPACFSCNSKKQAKFISEWCLRNQA